MQENSKIDFKIGDLVTWDLSELIKKDLITNVNPPENEIIPIPEKLMTVYDKKFPTYRKKRVVFAKIGNTYLAWATKENLFAERWDFVEEIQ